MRLVHLLYFLLFSTLGVFAQNNPVPQYNTDKFGSAAAGLNGPVGVFDKPKEIKGHPYMFEEWYNGEITFLNDRNLPVEKLRYDIYKDELLVFRNNKEMGILPKNLIKSFTLFNPKDVNAPRYVKAGQIPGLLNVSADQFVQVLYQNEKISLYVRNWKSFHKAENRATYYAEESKDEFSATKQEFFLVKNDGSVHEVKLRRGAVLNALEEQKPALKNYIKENQLFFDDTNDLVEVIKYYDQIAVKE